MLSLYEMFKVIFGLVMSSFILLIIVHFIGVYTQLDQDAERAQILKNFLKGAEDAYTTGNPLTFTDFRRQEFTLSFDRTPPPGIVSDVGKNPVLFPLFFRPGKEIFVSQGQLEMGWWTFRFVEAFPGARFLFSPVEGGEQSWKLVRDIAFFLPDSEFFSPTITFGVCDGQPQELCAGGCERQAFLAAVRGRSAPVQECTVQNLPAGTILITVASSCSPSRTSRGYCLTPPSQGIGRIFLSDQPPLLYKDPVDIVAALAGGEEKDLYGSSGATIHGYKNDAFRQEVLLGAEVMEQRAFLLAIEHRKARGEECAQAFDRLRETLQVVQSSLSDPQYYQDPAEAAGLGVALAEARAAQQALADQGCDYA